MMIFLKCRAVKSLRLEEIWLYHYTVTVRLTIENFNSYNLLLTLHSCFYLFYNSVEIHHRMI